MTKIPGVVIGGSPRFVNAVIAPLAGKLGVWPEVAPDAQEVVALSGGAWLAVLELQGDDWLGVAHELRALHGPELSIVVAMPPEHAAALPADAADELVSWDGAAGPVLEAVERLATARRRLPAPAPPAPPSREEHPVEIEKAGADATAPAAALRLGVRFSDTWPGTVHARSEAESVLVAAVAGLWPQEALRPLAERVVASLSDLEKAALRGDPIPVEPGPVRRAAALRWVVTAALERAPAPGGPVDGAAVQAMLGDIDGALGELKSVGQTAPLEAHPALEALRRVLVKEAIDLTDAVHRIVPSRAVARPRAPAISRRDRPGQTAAPGARAPQPYGARRSLWGALAIAVAAAAVLHGWSLVARQSAAPPPGAPRGTIGRSSPPPTSPR